jgi:hypothetical protein
MLLSTAGGPLKRRTWSQVTNTYGHAYLHRPDLALLRWGPQKLPAPDGFGTGLPQFDVYKGPPPPASVPKTSCSLDVHLKRSSAWHVHSAYRVSLTSNSQLYYLLKDWWMEGPAAAEATLNALQLRIHPGPRAASHVSRGPASGLWRGRAAATGLPADACCGP